MEENQETYLIALAGLLHDIGKFAQRAGEKGTRTWDAEAQRDYKYFHALLTSDFIEKYVPEAWRIPVKLAAAGHHRPGKRAETILALADHLSAGERADLADDQRAAQPRQLLSIFCSTTADGLTAPGQVYWPLRPLKVGVGEKKENLFPSQAKEDSQVWSTYESLWEGFCQEAAALRDHHQPAGDLAAYLENLLDILQRYTWCMPSAYYRARPDISLHDHDRMTGALCAILNDSTLNDEGLKALLAAPQESDDTVALLVGGDLSGVQDFIYTISARGATSALRGRSFYLQILTDVVVRYILLALDLPATNVIYAGGGNFYLLARPGDGVKLVEIQKRISQVLFYHHRGDLYMALAELPLQSRDFFHNRLSNAWGELNERLQRAKLQRFAELGHALVNLFQPIGHGGNLEAQCQVCGQEHADTHIDPKTQKGTEEDGVRKCPPCLAYEELGETLRQAEYLVLTEMPPIALPDFTDSPLPGSYQAVLQCFGFALQFGSAGNLAAHADSKRSIILAFSENAREELSRRSNQTIIHGRRFLVNVTPLISEKEIKELRSLGLQDLPAVGSTKPFHAMEAQSQGIKRLGVLRMDVDNLGQLFSKGLGEYSSLSRVASLSFAVSLFFEGWVDVLAVQMNEKDKKGNRLYSVYSGGDDLFFVGAWDAIVELARQVRVDLADYAAGHPGIHASAGIALIDGKYPLYQAARDAHHALEQAKHLRWWGVNQVVKKKDAISFLGQTLPWLQFGLADCTEKNIHTAHALMHMLVSYREKDKTTANQLIRRLAALHLQYQQAEDDRRRAGSDVNRSGKPQSVWGPWNWLGFYSLSRMVKQHPDPAVRELRDQLKADDFRSITWMGLAARWAELLCR